MTATSIELNLYRERLVSSTTRPTELTAVCKRVARLAGKYQRAALAGCNGLPKQWDSRRKEWIMGLSEGDTEMLDATIEKARVTIETELRRVLIRGLEYDFRNDPRYTLLRIRTQDNRRASDIF